MVPDAVKKQLRLPRLGQIGYVVTDVEKTMAYYKDVLGIRPWLLLDERPDPCIEREREVHPLLRIALAYMGSVQVELIQVLQGESLHLDHVKESQGGVHHLGFMVQDLYKRLDACHKIGIGILQRGTIKDVGFTIEYAYLDTVEQAGIILEFIQWRLGSMPVPISRSVYNVVSWVGARTLLKGKVVK